MKDFNIKSLLILILALISHSSASGSFITCLDLNHQITAGFDSTDCIFTCLNENISVLADPTTCNALVEIELVDFPIGVGGYNILQMPAQVKSNATFCPTPAVSSGICDCPEGYVAVGYSAEIGNGYGANVVSRFRLYCRQLNSDGSLGSTTISTCYNGTLDGTTGTSGPVFAAAGSVLVGAQVNLGCAMDRIVGRSKPVSLILANQANTINTTLAAVGGTGGSSQPLQIVPNGSAIVGMLTYIDQTSNNICAGVAWRYANLSDMLDAVSTCGTIVNSFNNTDNPSGTYPIGTTTVDYTFTDIDGNTTECSFDVTVLSMIAGFSVETEANNLTVSFTNESEGYTSLQWDFGDGNTSGVVHPVHDYIAEGVYTVCLTLMNDCDTATVCEEVTVICPAPIAAFSFTTDGLIINVENQSESGLQYNWFIDGEFINSSFEFSWEFSETGIYELCLEVENNCGTVTICDSIDLSCIDPVAGFVFEQTGNTFNFTNTSEFADTYHWDFGDGNTSTEENPSHTYTTESNFEVCLTVSNDCDEETHCEDLLIVNTVDHSQIKSFVVYPNPANDFIFIEVSFFQPEQIVLEIMDAAGRIIYTHRQVGLTRNLEKRIETKQFSAGIYLLKILIDSRPVHIQKIMLE
jgi:PKD repeat protein